MRSKKKSLTGGFDGGGYISDKRLVARVHEYLAGLPRGQHLDVSTMAEQLQAKYSEYGRRKKNVFRASVHKVYSMIKQKQTLSQRQEGPEALSEKRTEDIDDVSSDGDESEDSSSGSFSADNEDYESYQDTNMMNTSMLDLYNKRSSNTPGGASINSNPAGTSVNPSTASQDSTPSNSQTWFVDRTPSSSVQASDKPGKSTAKDMDDKQTRDTSKDVPKDNGDRKKESTRWTYEEKKADKTIQDEATSQKKLKRKTEEETDGVGKKRKGNSTKGPALQKSTVKFADVGGIESCLQEVCKLLVHLRHPEVYQTLGVTPPRGFLLHGPPGCGKTLLANAIAGELELPLLKIAATEIVSGVSGESEEKVRDLFEKAVASAPCILFIDEIDAITPKRETAQREMERRIVAQLLTCMDDLSANISAHVLVIGATNRPDFLDPALRRAGRFDREISMGIPDERAREGILQVLCQKLRLSEGFSYRQLAHLTPGYVGADLSALCREAAMTAINRILTEREEEEAKRKNIEVTVTGGEVAVPPDAGTSSVEAPVQTADITSVLSWLKDQPPLTQEQLQDLSIQMEDFQVALSTMQPSAKREGFATIPDVTWDDVGALQDIREELTMAILAPVKHREKFESLGLVNPPGVLLAGPPGCGKTLLAKAIANESGVNFISVKGPELLNMYVGESERAVRQVFQRARNSAPCVIFFDELDALCPRRSSAGESSGAVRVVNQLLTEMDGLEARKQVFIMGATNRPDIIDPAVLRPGRMDKLLFVGLPSEVDREAILNTITKHGTRPPIGEDVCLASLARDAQCNNFTGADLAALVREAAMSALRESVVHPGTAPGTDWVSPGHIRINLQHFNKAFQKVRPSVSEKDRAMYEKMWERIRQMV
ncbi:PREDICTED: nuclear valosin-containing protein-like [Branchiostoma belcheri]|uniref:Nuclear valosin-containing protein-like n=1 Tax=Branchiostoma belcheri TaxID=7741 RepID=A0A6P4Y2Q5_BRABE|nr:PREDICTED: nuclear valosin-containing protein-like [Branchiostoma belcheri]